MSKKLIKFFPRGSAKNPDAVIEQAIGNYDSVVIIGRDKTEKLDVRASTNLSYAEILWLISLFSQKLLNGDYGE